MPLADLILKNANVIAMGSTRPGAGSVAIAGGRILLVAGDQDVAAVTGPKTRTVDCHGRTVVPGFNDAHCHIFSFIRKLLSVDISPSSVASIADIKAAIWRRAEDIPPGTWITGDGFNEFYLTEKRFPDRRDIDEVAPNNPVVLSHRSLHACVLNSLALSLAGITIETPDSPDGMIDRYVDTGEPNGILYQMLGHIREKVMPPMSEEDLARGTAQANRYYLSYGITSLQDASMTNDLDRWQALKRCREMGRLQPRVGMMLGNRARDKFQEAGLRSGSGDSGLRAGAVKLMLTATKGRLQPGQEELSATALDIHNSGFQLAFHAVEPDAVEAAIAALEHVNSRSSSIAGRRHRIEHCAECPPHLLERLKKLGAVIAVQPPFLYYSGERYLATLPTERLPWLCRFRSFIDAGLTVAGSSDSPIVPNNPLVGMYAAVTRLAATGQELLPGERISPREALAMYTFNAAFASSEETTKGSISTGKLADLVVLSGDPLRVPPEKIKDIRVEITIMGGKVVWEA